MTKQYKDLTDEEKMDNIEKLSRLNIEDKDDIIMDFEVDIERMIKKISVKQLLNNNKKHLKKFTDSVMRLERQIYLPLNVQSSVKQANRFNRLFTEGVTA